MDTDKMIEVESLKELHNSLVEFLKANGFEWESNFAKESFSSMSYRRRQLVVKLIWDHTNEKGRQY